MDLEYVTKLIDLLSKSTVDEIEIEEDGKRVRIAKRTHTPAAPATVLQVTPPAAASSSAAAPHAAPDAVPPAVATAFPVNVPPAPSPSPKLHEVRSPIVGTFYRAPAPDAPQFVQVGSVVQKGSVLCIVEAMKLMNEIESDVAGKIVQIMVENQQPVEYDQVLFIIEPV